MREENNIKIYGAAQIKFSGTVQMKPGIGHDRTVCVSSLTKSRENHLTVFV